MFKKVPALKWIHVLFQAVHICKKRGDEYNKTATVLSNHELNNFLKWLIKPVVAFFLRTCMARIWAQYKAQYSLEQKNWPVYK